MKENKINYGLLIFIGIVIILFIPIIIDYYKNQNIDVLSSSEISTKIKEKNSFLIYVGDVNKSTKKELRKLRDKTKSDYSIEYGVFNSSDSSEIDELFGKEVVAAIVIEGDIQKTYDKYEASKLDNDVDKYFIGEITEENKSYKVAENFKSYKKIVNDKKLTMAVFGRESCFYCNKFKPVYDAVAEKYDLDIYYFDSDSYNMEQYKKIVNMDLTVPAKCNSNGIEFKLSEGFGTPLTIITKSGKVVDCISGYVNRTSLVETLKLNKMISE